jgi:glycosyltransferase involved in cell wall biosynthesis
MGAPVELVSVIVPLRNELANVGSLVSDLAAQDFEGDLEVLVADGGSEDGGIERLRTLAREAGLSVQVIDNPAGWVSPGLNACIRAARGDLVVRLDCHSRYPSDYLRRCAELSEQTGAWNVGGQLVPTGTSIVERAVACAMDSPFGGIGWTRFNGTEPTETDTVTFGAFRREVFERVGMFDEALVRNQDDEFNMRLRAAGGTIVLDPAITVAYRPRGSLGGVWRQYFEYGLWKIPVVIKHRRIGTLRGVVPAVFVLGTGVLLAAAPRSRTARRLLGAEVLAYGSLAAMFAVRGVSSRRESWRLLPSVLAAFPAFHVGHGCGQVIGLMRAVRRRQP